MTPHLLEISPSEEVPFLHILDDGSLIVMLTLLREAVAQLSGSGSDLCGFIRGLDVSIETFTRSSSIPETSFKELEERATRIGHRDEYHRGCAKGLMLAPRLVRQILSETS